MKFIDIMRQHLSSLLHCPSRLLAIKPENHVNLGRPMLLP